MFDTGNEVCSIYNSFTGKFEAIPLYYGLWGKSLVKYFNDVMLLQTYWNWYSSPRRFLVGKIAGITFINHIQEYTEEYDYGIDYNIVYEQ